MSATDFQKQAQDYYSQVPAIILGCGASAAFGISGMGALANYIIANVDTTDLDDKAQECWQQFCGLLKGGTDLETALHQIALPEVLTQRVIINTWELINQEDLAVLRTSFQESDLFPLGQLIRAMFRSALQRISIITTNYDRLCEYACDQEGIHHYTGFSHGYIRRLVDDNYLQSQRKVNIWKVHGSLDWFKTQASETCGLGVQQTIPEGYQPQIITPGVEKYRLTHFEPYRTTITQADNALQQAASYLCIGFGFNDQHIQEKLIERCVRDNASITVVTYGLTEAAKYFLFESGVKNYLAIERGKHDDQSIIHSSQLDKPIVVEDNYWNLRGYLSLIL